MSLTIHVEVQRVVWTLVRSISSEVETTASQAMLNTGQCGDFVKNVKCDSFFIEFFRIVKHFFFFSDLSVLIFHLSNTLTNLSRCFLNE